MFEFVKKVFFTGLAILSSILCQELMKQDTKNGTKRVNVSVNLGLIFVIINSVGIKINVGVNAKN